MIPVQHPKKYIADVEQFDRGLGQLVSALRFSLVRFWQNPPIEAAKINAEVGSCGMTPAQVWQSHGFWIAFLLTNYPDRMSWFVPPLFEVKFTESGLIDLDQLGSDWIDYVAGLPES